MAFYWREGLFLSPITLYTLRILTTDLIIFALGVAQKLDSFQGYTYSCDRQGEIREIVAYHYDQSLAGRLHPFS